MLIVMAISLVASVVILISTYFIQQQKADMSRLADERAVAIRRSLQDKGVSLARSLAVASERAIVVLDYSFLDEVVTTTVEADPEVIYGIIMNAERRALVHTDGRALDRILDDPASQDAARQRAPMTRELSLDGRPILEAVAPIAVGGAHWGTIRFGLSLDRVNREVAEGERQVASQIIESVIATLLAAALLLVLGSVIGTFVAARIARPLRGLATAVESLERGDFSADRPWMGVGHWVSPASEFRELGRAFGEMAKAVNERDDALRRTNRDLAGALEAAKEASRLKSEFVANVSHELRTPLNSIVNAPVGLLDDFERVALWRCDSCSTDYRSDLEGVEEPCPECRTPMRRMRPLQFVGDADEHQTGLEQIAHSGRHLLAVVNDLLDFSKLEAGKMSLAVVELSVGELFREVAATMGGLAEREGIDLAFDGGGDLRLVADKLKLSQVLINLIGNAIKYTPRGGLVDVTALQASGAVRISVKDTGIGVQADQIAHIFESFRQVDGGKTRKHGGTGLGLAISKRLVDLHGGRIWAESVHGSGSTFHVEIPFDAESTVGRIGPAPKGEGEALRPLEAPGLEHGAGEERREREPGSGEEHDVEGRR
jgi:signal transduction histidine kinase